ncbi:MAG: hypothetical protein KAV87_48900 [Desulfobacteraceae bacterium]|nr:hypothetical protein [Desulfobacteraceae bacterium]
MQELTLFIALAVSVIVLLSSPIFGLIIYIAAFAWYPTYLTVPVGTIDFTVRRIVILAIYAKLFLGTGLPERFRFIWLDKIVIIYFAAQVLAGATTAASVMAFLENRAGAIFDTVLPYFAVRMIIRNRQQYLILLKAIVIIAVPLAIIGFYECLTGKNPVGFMQKYSPWRAAEEYFPRYGFFRARFTFWHSIMYGLFFAIFGPICAGILAHVKKYKTLCWTGLGLMGVGVFSSMSSGPWLATLLAVPFIAFYRWRKHWKPVVIIIIVMCGFVEIISNMHFYDVLSRYTFSLQTAWYRRQLIHVALFEGGMSGHWLTGFPFGTDPGWGPKILGLSGTDMVNHYLAVLVRFGLVGFVPFLAMNVAVVKKLIDTYKASILDSDKWLIWCLSASLFGLAGAFMSVSLFGPPTTIYYMMIGFCGVMPLIVKKRIRSRDENVVKFYSE